MKYAWNAEKRTHVWTFAGDVGVVEFTVPVAQWVQDCGAGSTADAALIHGYKQKIGDAAAIARNTETGATATDADKRDAMQAVVDRLNNGEWNAVARGGGAKVVNIDALVAAIAAVTNKPVVAVRAWVESKTDEQRKAYTASREFAEAYAIAVAQARPRAKLDETTAAEIDSL